MKKKVLFSQSVSLWLPVVMYCSLIFYMSSGPIEKKMLPVKHMDKIIHAGEYFILSFLLTRAIYQGFWSTENKKVVLYLPIFLTIGYGVSDEIHQYFVPSRQADVLDVLFDALGAFLGQKGYLYRMRFMSLLEGE